MLFKRNANITVCDSESLCLLTILITYIILCGYQGEPLECALQFLEEKGARYVPKTQSSSHLTAAKKNVLTVKACHYEIEIFASFVRMRISCVLPPYHILLDLDSDCKH